MVSKEPHNTGFALLVSWGRWVRGIVLAVLDISGDNVCMGVRTTWTTTVNMLPDLQHVSEYHTSCLYIRMLNSQTVYWLWGSLSSLVIYVHVHLLTNHCSKQSHQTWLIANLNPLHSIELLRGGLTVIISIWHHANTHYYMYYTYTHTLKCTHSKQCWTASVSIYMYLTMSWPQTLSLVEVTQLRTPSYRRRALFMMQYSHTNTFHTHKLQIGDTYVKIHVLKFIQHTVQICRQDQTEIIRWNKMLAHKSFVIENWASTAR